MNSTCLKQFDCENEDLNKNQSSKILPTPQEMIDYLNIYVRGQDDAKKILAKAVYFHYFKLQQEEKNQGIKQLEHIMLLGPSGSGKTLMVKTLAKMLGVPFFFVNAAQLTAEGYVGNGTGDVLYQLASYCNYDDSLMNRAIIFFDEIDKIASSSLNNESSADKTRVQQELLAILDGNLNIQGKNSYERKVLEVDTSKILIVTAGAFQGIEDIIKKRKNEKVIGFANLKSNEKKEDDLYNEITSDDLIEYGFLPEFVGRFYNVATLSKLTVDDYKEILMKDSQSPLTPYRDVYKQHGLDLVVTDTAINELANMTSKEKTGGRSLHNRISNILKDISWRVPNLAQDGVGKILINEETVKNNQPLYIKGESGENISLEVRKQVFANVNFNVRDVSQKDKTEKKTENKEEGEEKERLEKEKLERTKNELIEYAKKVDYPSSIKSANKWWEDFIDGNIHKPEFVKRLVDELTKRGASIKDFFFAYIYSCTDNIQANLDYLDYIIKSQTKDNIKNLLRDNLDYSNGREISRLVWNVAEKYIESRDYSLLNDLKRHKIDSIDDFFNAVCVSQTVVPSAVISYLEFFNSKNNDVQVAIIDSDFPNTKDLFLNPTKNSFDDFNYNEKMTPTEHCLCLCRQIAECAIVSKLVRNGELKLSSEDLERLFPSTNVIDYSYINISNKYGVAKKISKAEKTWLTNSLEMNLQIWGKALNHYPYENIVGFTTPLCFSFLADDIMNELKKNDNFDLLNIVSKVVAFQHYYIDECKTFYELVYLLWGAECSAKASLKIFDKLVEFIQNFDNKDKNEKDKVTKEIFEQRQYEELLKHNRPMYPKAVVNYLNKKYGVPNNKTKKEEKN